jgi:hypothetical protein
VIMLIPHPREFVLWAVFAGSLEDTQKGTEGPAVGPMRSCCSRSSSLAASMEMARPTFAVD